MNWANGSKLGKHFNGHAPRIPPAPRVLPRHSPKQHSPVSWGLHEDVVPTLIEGINAAGNADEYHNPLYPWSAVHEQITATYREEFDKKNFADAINLAAASGAMLTPETAHELLAQARIAWGDELMLDEATQSQAAAEKARKQSSELYRAAGRDYEELANLRFTDPQYLDHVWNSADIISSARITRQPSGSCASIYATSNAVADRWLCYVTANAKYCLANTMRHSQLCASASPIIPAMLRAIAHGCSQPVRCSTKVIARQSRSSI